MAVRILTSIIGLPVLIAVLLLGGIYLKLGVLIVSLIGMYEFYKAVDKKILPVHGVGFAFAILYILTLNIAADLDFKLIITAFVPIALIVQIVFNEKININNTASAFFGFLYVAFMFSNLYLLRETVLYGKLVVWLVIISAFCCDTGAYFTGRFLGKHKLAPVLSPKKTVEGAVGGVIAAGLCSALYGAVINEVIDVSFDFNMVLVCGGIGTVGAVFAELGDLAASSIKRYTGIKDYGNIMPGHGGVLDRFDSVIFTSAVVYLFSLFFFKV